MRLFVVTLAFVVLGLAERPARLAPIVEPDYCTYNYAPSFMLDSARRRLHVWYCAGAAPGEVRDRIVYRHAERLGGRWRWSGETVALEVGGAGAWDSRHVCDPDVVRGRFLYRGRIYGYAMLYLGTDAEGSTHNQTGLALATAPQGPWTRYPAPIVRYTSVASGGIIRMEGRWPVYRYWGVGQPSAVSLDRRGRLLLFVSRGEETDGVEMMTVDLSDLDRGPVVSGRRKLSTRGLRPASPGSGDVWLTNIGIAREARTGRVWMLREDIPARDGRFPSFISARVRVARSDWAALQNGQTEWHETGEIGPAETGWPRNHNASFVRDGWGDLRSGATAGVGISLAESYEAAPSGSDWLWSYRIGLVDIPIRVSGNR